MNKNVSNGRHRPDPDPDQTRAEKKEEYLQKLANNLGVEDRRTPEKKETAPKGAKSGLPRGVKITVIAVGGVLLLMIALLSAFLLWSRPPETNPDDGLKVQATATPDPVATQVPDATPSPTPIATATPEPVVRKADTYTLLVVGRDFVGLNTDTLLVVRMDCAEKTINVVSIPRDTLVNVDWAVKKVNSVYGSLGATGFLNEIENLVGFDIDNYVIVNPYIFSQVIDCVGGIWYEVPFHMYYYDPDQNLTIDLQPGYQLLNGQQCEQLVRYRSGYANGDLGRIQTQQNFLREAARQMLSIGNITNLSSIISLVTENTDTDLTAANIAFYAEEFLKMGTDCCCFYTLPSNEVYIRGGSYVSIRLQEWLELINACFNPWNVDVTEENLDVLCYDGTDFYSTTGHIPSYYSFYDYTQIE